MSSPKAKQNKGSRCQSKLSTEKLTQSKEVALSLVANQRLAIFWRSAWPFYFNLPGCSSCSLSSQACGDRRVCSTPPNPHFWCKN